MKHGTASTYRNAGCRCEDCTTAARLAQREYRAKRRDRSLPAKPRKTLGRGRNLLHGATVKDAGLRECADCGLNLLPLAFPKVGDGRGDTCRNCLPHGAPLTPADWL